MTWSLPDPRPADPVLGDPASLAALAATLHRAAVELDDALEGLRPEEVGSRRHAARVKALRARAVPLRESMDRAARLLGDHASELADALGLARRLVDRAESAGLVVDGPAVSRGRGVQGVADAAAEATREEALTRLQRVLDAILIDLDTARRGLRRELADEHTTVRNR